jgi:predicted nucleic acid-binding protein
LINPSVFNQAVMLTSDHITDVYLLALAVSNGSRLVTTDGGILTTAVVGFRQQNLVLL